MKMLFCYEDAELVDDNGLIVPNGEDLVGVISQINLPTGCHYLNHLPHVEKDNEQIWYLPFGVYTYIVYYDRTQDVGFAYSIKQRVIGKGLAIEEIKSTFSINPLHHLMYCYYSTEKEKEIQAITQNTKYVLTKLGFISEREIMFLVDKIQEFFGKRCSGYEEEKGKETEKPKANTSERVTRKRKIEYRGVKYNSLYELCKANDYNVGVAYADKAKGKSIKEILEKLENNNISESRGRGKIKYYEYAGEQMTAGDLARLSGLGINTIKRRIEEKGWSVEQAVETPAIYNKKDDEEES